LKSFVPPKPIKVKVIAKTPTLNTQTPLTGIIEESKVTLSMSCSKPSMLLISIGINELPDKSYKLIKSVPLTDPLDETLLKDEDGNIIGVFNGI
jgi:hypothetical protein